MKTLYSFLIAILLFSGCAKDENLDAFDRHDDFAQFTLDGDEISLSKRGFTSKGVFTVSNQGELANIQIVVGRGVNKDGSGKWELDFAITKLFQPEELGINPQEFENQVQLSADHLYTLFSEPGDVVNELPVNIFLKSKSGVYMSFKLGDEYYTALPKIEIDNQEKFSAFSFKKGESSAPDQLKVEIQFDVYMQGQITGNIIHLENGKFIASYKWGEY